MKPILFSTEMVQAILEGRKTQTRRVVKPQPIMPEPTSEIMLNDSFGWVVRHKINERPDAYEATSQLKCPYGKVGDVLWVRETWCYNGHYYVFKADHSDMPFRWKPSIHMPKEACRLFLRITNIRVERLQDMGRQDALSEGIQDRVELEDTRNELSYYQYRFGGERFPSAVKAFEGLWTSINGEQSWNNNPWVWVVEFEKIEK